MLPYLLNLIYLALALLVSPLLVHSAVRKRKYREGWAEKLWGRAVLRPGHRKCVWLHAVSLGEVNLYNTLLPRLEQRFPDVDYVVSVTTKAAYDFARSKFSCAVFYCPLDFSWAVRQALARVRPDVLVLAELELWPNLIAEAKRRNVQVALINGRLSDKSYRGYQRVSWLFARLIGSLDLVAVQTDEYAGRFRRLGATDAVHVTGSIKFDGARSDRHNAATQQLARLAGIRNDDIVLLAGSTQSPEESYALNTFLALREQHPQLRLILVPRHAERFDSVADQLRCAGVDFQRRSRIEGDGLNRRAHVLLVDTIGELASWWGTARIAFVGGSMGSRGGQNMIEPAAYGAAVSFGPKTRNFRDIVALMLQKEAAAVVRDGDELTAFVRRCLDDPPYAAQLGRNARQLVGQQQGAVDRTIQLLRPLIDPGDEAGARHFPAA